MKTTAKTKWVLDPTHSELIFKVKHMMITNVKGEFKDFSIEVDGEDIFKSNVNVTINTLSIDTNNEDRDNHLKSADFFDAENHKKLTFKSTSFTQEDDDEYELKGILTIKGISLSLIHI